MFGPRKMVVFPRVSIFPETKSSTEKQTSKQTTTSITLLPLCPGGSGPRGQPVKIPHSRDATQRSCRCVTPNSSAQRTGCIWYHTEPSSYIIIKKVNFIFRVRTFHMIAPHTAGCQHVTWILGAFTNERPVTARRRFVNTRCTWERSNTRQL